MIENAIAIVLLLSYAIVGLCVVIGVPKLQMKRIKDTSHALAILHLENQLRRTTIQVVGGFGLILSLFFAWRTITLNEQTRISDQQARASIEQMRESDHFITQINELQSSDSPTRINALYELQELTQRTPSRREQFTETLAEWIRQQSRKLLKDSAARPRDLDVALRCLLGVYSRYSTPPPEIRTRTLELSGADLSNLNLTGLNFSMVNLTGANLSDADMSNADLRAADLSGANLKRTKMVYASTKGIRFDAHTIFDGTNLQGADLEQVQLSFATLKQVNLYEANLRGGSFFGSSFDQVSLTGADLTGAHFQGANLVTVNGLKKSQIDLADTDATTRLPRTFVPENP